MRCEITSRNLRKITNQISTLEVRREAQEIRAVVLAIAVRIVFQRITRPFITLQGLIDRAHTMQRVTEFDDNWLAEMSGRRADIPAYVAGRVEAVRKVVADHKDNEKLREAA